MIPFVDLKAQYQSIQPEIDKAIYSVVYDTAFIGGEYAAKFEKEFAEFIGTKFCVDSRNGTDSLEILLQAMGIGRDDEVIVPAISWISTSEAVSSVGGTPVFVDIDPKLYTIDLAKIEEKITPRTKAIIPVHLYGQPVDMPKLMALAKKHGLKVLEDCAQAHGAQINGKNVGTFGDCASFSFYPGKNLGAYGDAGGMVTDNPKIARTARMIANHGQEGKHNHIIEGRNSRMAGIDAAVLSVKLKYLNSWTDTRIANASKYEQAIDNVEVIKPSTIEDGKHVFHLYVIRTEQREKLIQDFKKHQIGFGIHYPTALPLLKCYQHFGFTESDFPETSRATQQIISLPMYAEMTDEMIHTVSYCINQLK